MTGCNTLIAATLLSMTAVTSAGAQLPNWALSEPSLYQAQYPDRDFFNDGALTPAGRMGLELPGGAAPVFRPRRPLFGGEEPAGPKAEAVVLEEHRSGSEASSPNISS